MQIPACVLSPRACTEGIYLWTVQPLGPLSVEPSDSLTCRAASAMGCRDSLLLQGKARCHLLGPCLYTEDLSGCSSESLMVTGSLLSIPAFTLDSQITFPLRFTVLKWVLFTACCPTVKFWMHFISLTISAYFSFSSLQEKCFFMGVGKRWKSEGAQFGVSSWSGIVFWSLLKKRVKKLLERLIPFFWIITYGTMPVITGKIWKEFHFIVHVAYIIDP